MSKKTEEILTQSIISFEKNITQQAIEKICINLDDFASQIETVVKSQKKELKIMEEKLRFMEEKSRLEGIYQDVQEKIKTNSTFLKQKQEELSKIRGDCLNVSQNYRQMDGESWSQLQSYYKQYDVASKNYYQAANILAQKIDRKVSEDEIVKDYDELESIRVDTFGELFDTITEYIINLKSQTQKKSLLDTLQSLEDKVYEISDSVVSIDEGIKANFEKSYPQETESDFKQVGDVAQSENYSQIIDVESRSQLQSCYKQYIAACKNYFLAAKRLRQKIDRKVPEDEIVKDYDELESIRVDTFGELFDTITEYIINLKSQTQKKSLLDTLQSLEDKVYEISDSVGSTNEKIQANFEKNY